MTNMLTKRSLGMGSLALCAAATALAMHPRDASACGGMFCDGGPQPMPVDQTGENILFVWEGDEIEAHIQIQYTGEAAQFGWVIPLQSVPEFSVGSEPLFSALLAASVPTYGFSQTFDDCSLGDEGSPDDANSTAAGGDTGSASDSDPTNGDGGGGPQILLTETVGAFDITVLQGGTGQEVFDWLELNGYQQDMEALPILDEYIAEGHLFGAIKLTGGADVDQIHPIVLRFQGSEPCVPLRLTRIAAVEDMGVRSFFLGASRMVPSNYRHVLVNPLKIDWRAPTNYNDIVTLAVDEENANGRAFVTEYAGPSNVVQTFGVYSEAWNAAAFDALAATEVGTELQDQGLLFCDFDFGNGCTFTHPLMEGLLTELVPLPADLAAADYWANQDNYPDVDLSTWDGAAFAAGLSARVIEPGMHAADLVQEHPYLTRMFTTISPAEMTEDPQFQENASLPEVPNLLNGVLRTLCNGDQVFTLPDGREIYLPAGGAWPDFPDEPGGVAGAMPSSEIIEEVPATGAPMRLTDNTEKINLVLASWNQENGWPGIGSGGADESGGSDSETDDAGADGSGDDAGCGCATQPPGSTAWAWLGILGLAAARRRSRRS
jgi:MYXO-CTERM domain-containing protein